MRQIAETTGICFFRVDRSSRLLEFLSAADFSTLPVGHPPPVAEWLHYGSVYVDGRRARQDQPLIEGQVLRVHTRRKTYVAQIPDLRPRVVADLADFLVLDKPSGLPTHATLDNCIENASYLLSQQVRGPLFVTHRLDVGTRGLLILAKTPTAQARINKIFAKRRVRKLYRAVTRDPVSLGEHVHFMDPASLVPKVVAPEVREGWWECRLIVRRSEPGWVSEIELLTGKTHQIRAQLAALGAPIDGDRIYGATAPPPPGCEFDLACTELAFHYDSVDHVFTRNSVGP